MKTSLKCIFFTVNCRFTDAKSKKHPFLVHFGPPTITRMLSSHSRKAAELYNLPGLGWLLKVLIPAMQDTPYLRQARRRSTGIRPSLASSGPRKGRHTTS